VDPKLMGLSGRGRQAVSTDPVAMVEQLDE
jgi:hypothetical protein